MVFYVGGSPLFTELEEHLHYEKAYNYIYFNISHYYFF